jgi:hypothetical protein
VYNKHYKYYFETPGYEGESFDEMIDLFVKDDFYKLHDIAKNIKKLLPDIKLNIVYYIFNK